jgi:hypothetical protein
MRPARGGRWLTRFHSHRDRRSVSAIKQLSALLSFLGVYGTKTVLA